MATTENVVDSTLAKDIRGLVGSRSNRRSFTLKAKPVRDKIPSAIGVGAAAPVVTSGGGSSIASPLTEQSRESSTVTVADQFNLWSIEVSNPTKITMLDANDAEVVFNYSAT